MVKEKSCNQNYKISHIENVDFFSVQNDKIIIIINLAHQSDMPLI